MICFVFLGVGGGVGNYRLFDVVVKDIAINRGKAGLRFWYRSNRTHTVSPTACHLCAGADPENLGGGMQ